MSREINPPMEIWRRLVYVFYLGLLIWTLVMGSIGLLGGEPELLFMACVPGLTALVIRKYGRRQLEFSRLADSFPLGAPADKIDPELRREMERLLARAESPELTWQERSRIRQQVTALIHKDERLFAAKRRKILAVHPSLTPRRQEKKANPD